MATPSLDAYVIFFRNPREEPDLTQPISTLYMVRRDALHCVENSVLLFPGMMTIMAGIDLLAKFHSGQDSVGNVGTRFKRFVTEYFSPLNPQDEEILYKLRHALMHSFGLYDQRSGFAVVESIEPPWDDLIVIRDRPSRDYHIINIGGFHRAFERAVSLYWEDLRTSQDLQDNFRAMFPNYGATLVRPSVRIEISQPNEEEESP